MDEPREGKAAFHSKAFERIDPARRETILRVATAEFAAKGYAATGINQLAKAAGVSIGSLYSYFASKEDLFLAIVDQIRALLSSELDKVDDSAGFFACYESLIRLARDSAGRYPELNQIYLDSTTQGNAGIAARLSDSIEAVTGVFYRRIIEAGKARGELRPELDAGVAAFCLDNLLVLFQFSFSSDYYRERLRVMVGLGPDEAVDDERIIRFILDMARRAFGVER